MPSSSTPRRRPWSPGDVIAGRFELQAEIGRGGAGTVWRASDRWTGDVFAIKELAKDLDRVPDEVLLLADLRHPNLANLHDYLPGPRPAFSMDLVEGKDVTELSGACDAATLAQIAADCLGALVFLHGRGILHRDVKPANVRVTAEGHAVLLDLGLAALATDDPTLAGTPRWLAPEVLEGGVQSAAADMYALGATLREAANPHALRTLGGWLATLCAETPETRVDGSEALETLRALVPELDDSAVLLGPRLVGRASELDALAEVLDALVEDGGRAAPSLLLLQGPAGSGRRRLQTAARHRAQMLGIPALDLSRVAVTDTDTDTDTGDTDLDLSPGELAARRTHAVELKVTAVKRDETRALVLCIDATESDPQGRDLLHRLLAPDVAAGVLVIARADPGDPDVDAAVERLGDRARRIEAGPLADSALEVLMQDALSLPDGAPSAAAAARAVRERTSSLPGPFLTALQALAATGGLVRSGGRAVLTVAKDDIPTGDAEAGVAAALAALPDSSKRAFERLLAFGSPLGPAGRRAVGIDRDAERALLRRGLAQRTWRNGAAWLGPAIRIDPAGVTIDDPDVLADAAREAAHELGPAGPRLEAWHRVRGRPRTRDLENANALAEQALLLGSVTDARRLLRAVASAASGAARARLDAALQLARVDAGLGDGPSADVALQLAEAAGDSALDRARTDAVRGEVRRLLGAIPDATAALDRALAAGLEGDERARALRIRAVCRLQLGRTVDALDDAVAAQDAAAGDRERATCVGTRAQVLHRAGRTDDALQAVDEALAITDAGGGPFGTLPAGLHQLRGLIRAARGEPAAAIADLEDAAEAFRSADHLVNLANTLNNIALLYERTGRIDDACAAHDESRGIRTRVGDLVGIATSQVNRGSILVRTGRLGEARIDLEGGLAGFTRQRHPRGRTAALCALSERDLAVGAFARALGRAEEALSVARENAFDVEENTARVLLASALVEDASRCDEAVRILADIDGPRAHAVRSRALARSGDLQGARTHARAAMESATTPEERLAAFVALEACDTATAADADALHAVESELPSPQDRLDALLRLAERAPERVNRRLLASRLEQALQHVEDEESLDMYTARWHDRIERTLTLLRDDGGGMTVQTMEGLLRVSRMLAEQRGPDEVLEEILDAAIDLAEAEHGFIVLREGDDFVCAAARRSERRALKVPKRMLSSTIIFDVLANGRAVATGNARDDARFGAMLSVNNLKLKSVACLPFTAGGRVRGAIYLDHPGRENVFSEARLRLLSAFADHAAIVFQRSEREQHIRELNDRLKELLKQERKARRAVSAELRRNVGPDAADPIVAESPGMRAVLDMVDRVAATDIPVLIVGDTGTGKDLIAREIHARSARSDGPFLSENCAAIPSGLLEAELFGARRGAYTGAVDDRPGLMTLASKGSLFLDEVGDMPEELQGKLLRALEEGSVRPLGAGTHTATDFRLITATNRTSESLRSGDRFRPDLFYRIGAAVIEIPSLAERPEDAASFIDRYGAARADKALELDPATRARLLAYDWPGNFRELQNELARLYALADGDVIAEHLLSERIRRFEAPASDEIPYDLQALRGWALGRALETSEGRKEEAARLLGVSRSTLYQELKKHGLGGHLRTYTRRSPAPPKEGG